MGESNFRYADVYLHKTLTVTGATALSSTLAVTGAVTLSSTLSATTATCSNFVVSSQVAQAYKAEYSITASQGAWVHGVKVELTRAANIQPATGGWFGGQFVLNAGSSGYDALDKSAYALQAVFKGSDTNPNGTDIHVARFEIQSAGKVSDIVYITANTGTTIVGSMLYLAAHINTKGILINVQSSATLSRGMEFMAGSGATMTSLLYASGAGTFTNFLEVAATGDGGITTGASLDDSGTSDIACDGYIKCLVGATPYYLPLYDTLA